MLFTQSRRRAMASEPRSPHQRRFARAPLPAASTSRPLVPSIELSVVYCPADLDHVDALSDGRARGFIYARDGHPNATQLAEKMARLEGGEAGLVCASGMGAIAVGLSHAALPERSRACRRRSLWQDDVARHATASAVGNQHDVFDPADAGSLDASAAEPQTRMIFAETISNPLLRVADLDSLAAVAREAGIPLVVDNTFAPLHLPADRAWRHASSFTP